MQSSTGFTWPLFFALILHYAAHCRLAALQAFIAAAVIVVKVIVAAAASAAEAQGVE